jgi:hypothetical protein
MASAALSARPGKSLCLGFFQLSLLLLVLAALAQPAAAFPPASPGVTYTGSASAQNFGSVNVSSPSTALLSFSVGAGTTVGSIEVVTKGAPGLDFTNGGSGSCAAQTYGSTTACTVDVTFTPRYPGMREGAVLFWSGAGNTGSVIGKTLVYGVGAQAGLSYSDYSTGATSVVTVTGETLVSPNQVTFDGAGNMYIADLGDNEVIEVPAGGGTATALNLTVNSETPSVNNVSIDGAGDLFACDNQYNRILEFPKGGTPIALTPTVAGKLMGQPAWVTVGPSGMLYINDGGNSRILEIPDLGTGTPLTPITSANGTNFDFGGSVELDSDQNLYYSDSDFGAGTPRWVEIPFSGGSDTVWGPTIPNSAPPPTNLTLGWTYADFVDAAGTQFATDSTNNRIIVIPSGSSSGAAWDPVAAGTGLNGPGEASTDDAGNIYIADYGNSRVVKVVRTASAPPVTATHFSVSAPSSVTAGTAFSVTVTALSASNATVTAYTGTVHFSSSDGAASLPANYTFVAGDAGVHTFTNKVTLNSSGSQTVTATDVSTSIDGSATIAVDEAPSITSANSTTFTVGAAGSFEVIANGYPAPTFLVTSGTLPSGVTLSNTGNLSGTPALGTGNSYMIGITASNGVSPNATQSFTLTVNQAPSITSASDTTFSVGSAGSFQVTGSGYPAPTFSVTGGTLPTGVTLSSTGVLSGTPAAGAGGTYPITITASNGVSPAATQNFTLTVDQSPAITSANSVTCSYNTGCTFTVTTTGNPTPSLIAGSLPSFASFTDNGNGTGTLTVAPAGKGGYFNITFKASNGVTPNVFQGFRIYLTEAPVIVSANTGTFTTGFSGGFAVTANGYPIVALSETGALPNGLTFRDNLNNTASIIGTPAAGTGGNYSITINGSNGLSPNASQNFTVTVDQAPAITSANSITFDPGISNTFTVTTTGFPAPSLHETGTLPSGVTFEDNGNGTATLAGTPAASASGNYPITITASNGVGAGATQKFTFGVLAGPALVSPAPSSTLKSWTQLFQWSLGNEGVTQSSLQVGTTGAGSSNVYNGTMGTATSVTVNNIPLTAATLYVRLNYMLKGNPYHVDYQLTEASIVAPVIQNPSSGATISGLYTFSWTPSSPTPSEYELRLGIEAPGSGDLFTGLAAGNTPHIQATIPSNGAKVYVTLEYELNGTWYSVSTTFMESGAYTAPSLSSPAASPLSGSTLFQWTGGAGIQYYELYVGTVATGSKDVYFSGDLPGSITSQTVTIPSNGKTIYVRLRYEVNGVWHNLDSTFTEAP